MRVLDPVSFVLKNGLLRTRMIDVCGNERVALFLYYGIYFAGAINLPVLMHQTIIVSSRIPSNFGANTKD